MGIRAEHELHGRRRGRNVGLGLMLAGFVVLVVALTVVKVTQIDFSTAPGSPGATATTEGND